MVKALTFVALYCCVFSFLFHDSDLVFAQKRKSIVDRKPLRHRFIKRACPLNMGLVRVGKQYICVDIFEFTFAQVNKVKFAKPTGFMNYYTCKRLCRARKKRMLTHTEWLAACQGTDANRCNIRRKNPVLRMKNARSNWNWKGLNCKLSKYTWGFTCMNDPRLNLLKFGLASNNEFSGCRSQFGIRHMVGNLGEWVDGTVTSKRRGIVGRFNGGLYPQPKSSCSYTTIAHGQKYSDYSLGCRCAKAARLKS